MSEKLEMGVAKKRLAVLWFTCFALLLLTMIVQTVTGHFGKDDTEAWGWFFPSIMPTLSLMIAVLVGDALRQTVSPTAVDKFMFQLAFSISLLYFVAVGIAIVAGVNPNVPAVTYMRMSNLWLGPLQGIVSGSLGLFFLRKPHR
jgi:uncharacterized membrane protein HdeD (DUF308 family)